MPSTSIKINPFPGLRAFQENENHLFFGREKEVKELHQKLLSSRFLAVVGTSGSGKSSLVRSGLLPALNRAQIFGSETSWKTVVFRPGNDPLINLSTALAQSLFRNQPAENLNFWEQSVTEAIITHQNNGLLRVVQQAGLKEQDKLVIVVDQFEELFRFSDKHVNNFDIQKDVDGLINILLESVSQSEIPIYVVLTMRYDFLGRCTDYDGLPEAINQGTYLVPRMTREGRKRAIEEPIKTNRVAISPILLARLLNETDDLKDQLPLLQHSLMRTWEYWENDHHPDEPLDLRHYEAIGTMVKALSLHAEEAFAELENDESRRICELLFKRITEKKPDIQGTRSPTALHNICLLTGSTEEDVKRVIDIFRKDGRSFLMPPSFLNLKSESVLDISHEALMRVWTRLEGWVREEAQSVETFQRIADSACRHLKKKAVLLISPELDISLDWLNKNKPNAIWAQRYITSLKISIGFEEMIKYLRNSKKQFDIEQKRKKKQQKSEIEREKKLREQDQKLHDLERKQHEQEKQRLEQSKEQQKQYLKYAVNIAWILGIAVVVSVSLMIKSFETEGLAENAQGQAEVERDKAKIAEGVAKKANRSAQMEKGIAENARDDAELQRLNALISQQDAEVARDDALKQKGIALNQSLVALQAGEKAEDETRIATLAKQRAEALATLAKQAENQATAAKFLAEAKETAIKSTFKPADDLTAVQEALFAFELNHFANKLLGRDTSMVEPEVFKALQEAYLIFNDDRLYPHETLASIICLGKLALVKKNGELLQHDLVQAKDLDLPSLKDKPAVQEGTSPFVRSMAYDQLKDRLAFGTTNGKIKTILFKEGNTKLNLPSSHNKKPIVALTFITDQQRDWLVSASTGKRVEVWDYNSSKNIASIDVDHRINDLLNIDNKYVIGADNVGNILKWKYNHLQESKSPKILFKHKPGKVRHPIKALTYNDKIDLLAAGDAFGEIVLMSLDKKNKNTRSFAKPHLGAVTDLVFSPDGKRLATASLDGTIMIWEIASDFDQLETGQLPVEIENTDQIYSIGFTPDSQYLIFRDNQSIHIRTVNSNKLYQIIKNQMGELAQK